MILDQMFLINSSSKIFAWKNAPKLRKVVTLYITSRISVSQSPQLD